MRIKRRLKRPFMKQLVQEILSQEGVSFLVLVVIEVIIISLIVMLSYLKTA